MNTQPIILGYRTGWNESVPLAISSFDLRQHAYVIGKTGVGKSTLLRNLILQQIAQGHGVGLIDPHGDLAEDLIRHIPPRRADDLVYFNPADLEFPLALNPLARVPADERHLVASGIVGSFKSIWIDSWGPRLEYILYNAVAALLECPNTSLLGVNRLLTDAAYRSWVIRQLRDPFIRSFWAEEFEGYDPRFQREAIAPIQNKIGQFLLNPVIRNILGQVKNRISFPQIINSGQIFIANLAKGRIGHDKSNLLGALLVTQFQLAAMARAFRPEAERLDFHLVIDEFQNFTTDAFEALLAEARKYRLALTLSHQYVEQLPLSLRQAVFGNVGTLIAFRVGSTDALALEQEFGGEFAAAQFVELDRFEVLVSRVIDGDLRVPFRATTLAPLAPPPARVDRLIARTRERFSTPRHIVEGRINRWIDNSRLSHELMRNPRQPRRPR